MFSKWVCRQLVCMIDGMSCARTGSRGFMCLDGVEKISASRQWYTCSANKQSELKTLSCACGRKFRRQGDLTRHKHFSVTPS